MTDNELKEILRRKSLEGFKDGLFAGTSGNLSIRGNEKKVMLITPSGVDYEKMKNDNIITMQLNGNVIDGIGKPSSEWKMHSEIYKAFPNINAIVHTHSPNATAFAVAGKTIPCSLIEMVFFLYGNIKVAPFQLPGSAELGSGAVPFLKNRTACLLANHGTLSIGNNLNEAYIRAVYVEDAAKISLKSEILGGTKEIDISQQNKIRAKMGLDSE